MKARATKAGLKILYPVPPNISLPITTPNVVARATIHNGIVGGMTKGINIPVTRNPSFISCFLTTAKIISQKPSDLEIRSKNKIPYLTKEELDIRANILQKMDGELPEFFVEEFAEMVFLCRERLV